MGYFWGKIGIKSVLVRRLFFRCFFTFSGMCEPRSARAGAVETQFFIFEAASKKHNLSKIFDPVLKPFLA